MNKTISLNGSWDLYYYNPSDLFLEDETIKPESLKHLAQEKIIQHIKASVPGNVELDLAQNNIISKDLLKGMNPKENEKWEDYEFWYVTTFQCPKDYDEETNLSLICSGVDCIANYYLNGEWISFSENAFIDHQINIGPLVKKKNTLAIHLFSTKRWAYMEDFKRSGVDLNNGYFHKRIRKPAHSFGWDIFPRCISAGITRGASLSLSDDFNIRDVFYHVQDVSKDHASLIFDLDIDAINEFFTRGLEIRIKGACKKSKFEVQKKAKRIMTVQISLDNPMLWWPEGYGEPNLYQTSIELLYEGLVLDKKELQIGVRSAKLKRTESLLEKDHCFQFVINNVPVLLTGSNWVPLSPYHSMDKYRYQEVLQYFTDTHSNIVRVWGGGTYEQEVFYDYCDRHGIVIWQDFMMACNQVDQDEEMLDKLREEFTWAVRKLRNHCSLILWAGDNEVDETMSFRGRNPATNLINRKLLPEILADLDPYREYLPSSPYIPEGFQEAYRNQEDVFVERHLWGARDYFKADFYKNSKAHFVSECGYQGCPDVASIREFIDEDKVWPIFNEEWTLHSSDQENSPHRVWLTWNQIRQYFAFEPTNIDDFSCASQISQAEAKKFFIERIRIHKPYTSGIIWWNMMDGWPQLSDAVVDFYHRKKLAYSYIKRSQEPVALMLDEMKDWQYKVFACNDTLSEVSGTYRVFDIDTNETLSSGSFALEKNETKPVGHVSLFYSDKKFLVIEWKIGKKTFFNHYVAGFVPFDFEKYKSWLSKFNQLIQ